MESLLISPTAHRVTSRNLACHRCASNVSGQRCVQQGDRVLVRAYDREAALGFFIGPSDVSEARFK